MSAAAITDVEAVKAMIRRHGNWYHRIELAPGIVTPGRQRSDAVLAHLDAMGLPKDASGLRVLDIGCRDGFFSFEMERRGAEVVPADYADPSATGFPIAAEVLGSALKYRVRNVYNLLPAEDGLFDVVLMLGLIYHLRNPMLALDRVRSVTKTGGRLFVESQVATRWFLRLMRAPVWQFCPGESLRKDASNKWAPNLEGLKQAVEESRFHVLDARIRRRRALVAGRAVDDAWLDHYRSLDSSEGVLGKKG